MKSSRSTSLRRRDFLEEVCLAATALAAGSVGLWSQKTLAQQMVSKTQAGYQEEPNGNERCGRCAHFMEGGKCKLVTGDISPEGWCRLYAPKG